MDEYDIILFDGVCNLCSGAVKFIIKRDRHSRFRFASLQSRFAREHLARAGLNPNSIDTIVLMRDDRLFQRSDAVLEIAKKLDGGWRAFYALRIVPRFIRDPMYDLITNKRYKWFGKMEACMIPTEDLRARFVE